MSEIVSVDIAGVESAVGDLLAVVARLPGVVPVRSYPLLPEPAQGVVDATWRFDGALDAAIGNGVLQCRAAVAAMRMLASDAAAADTFGGSG